MNLQEINGILPILNVHTKSDKGPRFMPDSFGYPSQNLIYDELYQHDSMLKGYCKLGSLDVFQKEVFLSITNDRETHRKS